MAKKSRVNRNERVLKLCDKFALEERMEARAALGMLPSASSPTRYRNRCALTGRSRGNLRKFGICRNALRLLAHQGVLPGVTKASW
jgi:small subunit ribosomal protein S14